MRIIFLNSWYAKAGKPFFDFIKKERTSTDVFALSEVQPELFTILQDELTGFRGLYEEGRFDVGMGYIYGQATFFKEFIQVESLEKISIFRNVYNDIGCALPFELGINNNPVNLISLHGKARPGHKLDTPSRLRQSGIVINYLKDKKGLKIIGGDFNLMPDTKSVKMFERAGYRNLIRDFDINETRNKFTWEQFPDEEKQHYADYCFVSRDVKVKNFQVPKVLISDHLPLILDFDI